MVKTADEIEQEFEDIIQRFVEEMERVDCPQEDYAAGVKSARDRFADIFRMVMQEIGR